MATVDADGGDAVLERQFAKSIEPGEASRAGVRIADLKNNRLIEDGDRRQGGLRLAGIAKRFQKECVGVLQRPGLDRIRLPQ